MNSHSMSCRMMLGLWLVLAATAALANVVGTIDLDQYQVGQGDPNSGLQMVAHYKITDPKGLAKCCDPKNLRWMQLVTSSAPTPFTPNPNRPFIDPRKGQKGGRDTGDGLPYYDATYPRDPNKYNDSLNYGIGPYIFDQAQVANTTATPGKPYTFAAETILVCITKPNGKPEEMTILGGFQWGFTITAAKDSKTHKTTYTTTALPLSGLSDSTALENQFNTALNIDFPGYKLVPCKQTDCGDNTFNFVNVSPEPSTWLLLLSGLAGAYGLMPRPKRQLLARAMVSQVSQSQ